MKIGIISDTHDDIESTKRAIKVFKREKVDAVFHLGDFISPPIIKLFDGLKFIGVFGNNDGARFMLIKTFDEIGGEIIGDFGTAEFDGLKMALYHGEFREISMALAKSGDYDVLFSGHWHKAASRKVGETLWVSIGSAKKEFAENNEPKVGIFETKTKDIKFVNI